MLVKGTDWSELFDMVSPSLFDVVRGKDIRAQVSDLAGSSMQKSRFAELKSALATELAKARVPLVIQGEEHAAHDVRDSVADLGRGQTLLRLYFQQLFHHDSTLLDIRHGRFGLENDGWVTWRPRSLFVTWDPDFLSALRNLYLGFYRDDDATFRRALASLRLESAEDVFRSVFGEGDQRAVEFRLADFKRTFHDVFVRCRESGVVLHRNFIALGVYLACLYEHLEAIGEPQDVRQAFDAVV
jgi:hypothetical protein